MKQCALFRDLPASSLTKVAWLSVSRNYARGETIFQQGDPGDALFVVVTGRVKISTRTGEGTEVFFDVLQTNDAFGEIALIDNQPRTASAIALEESQLLVVSRPHFMQLLEKDPTVSIHLLKLFCQRIRATSQLVEEAAFYDVPAKLAKRLLTLAANDDSTPENVIAHSPEELSEFLGVKTPIINQYLQQWKQSGWLDLGRANITLIKPGALNDYLSGAGKPEK